MLDGAADEQGCVEDVRGGCMRWSTTGRALERKEEMRDRDGGGRAAAGTLTIEYYVERGRQSHLDPTRG